jgi:hypothetical protein
MSDGSQFVAESLEELLVAIADGVREAQAALSQAPPFDAYGRPVPTYHLPYLDFNLKIDLQTVETQSGARLLKIMPLGNMPQKNQASEITSSLSGRFVAIPPGEGLPIPVIQFSSMLLSAQQHQLEIVLSNTAGERLVGAQVELNIDLAASKKLSATFGVSMADILNTQLHDALLTTDTEGKARTQITIDPHLPAKAMLVVSAEFTQQVSSIVVTAGNEA